MPELFDVMTYDTIKVTDILNIGETYQAVAQLVTPAERGPGLYEIKFTGTVNFPDTNDSFFLRWRLDAGDWIEFSKENKDVGDKIPFTYFYPAQFTSGSHTVDVEMKKSLGGVQLDLLYLDLVYQRVGAQV